MLALEITTYLGCSLAYCFGLPDRLVKSYPKGKTRRLSIADFMDNAAKTRIWIAVSMDQQ